MDSSGRAYAGSQRQIQTYVNERTAILNAAVAESLSQYGLKPEQIRWVSPLASDFYSEYRDSEFLEVLGLGQLAGRLREFWPRGGPCWDALAVIANGGRILVEAKSHVPEIWGGGCGASDKSRGKIINALDVTKKWLGARADADWTGRLYQSANRYAALYFLRELAIVPAFLLNVYFVGDPRTPTKHEDWEIAVKAVNVELGLENDPPYCGKLFLQGEAEHVAASL